MNYKVSPPGPQGLPAAATCSILQASDMALPLPSHLAAIVLGSLDPFPTRNHS